MFEVSTPINWLDAQSSCAIWGGDLTSITTERENNYLYTIIPDTVSKCWIGLNDREVEGTYTWTDGITSGYTNFTSTPSNDEINGCVEIDKTGEGSWVSVDCDTMRNTFLCKRDSTVISGLYYSHYYVSMCVYKDYRGKEISRVNSHRISCILLYVMTKRNETYTFYPTPYQ